ncbi:hypothetical protein DFH07DRAFT_755635 [Mycena maculata]|uniref:Uncharacterized protein n=1 Tax=Mycena maculata TaxID=230809 RepID=A0AAD7HZ63_9AGAR|nr:hypothetical protein DFH07DRAFT_755635 [Mycena maculata]
MSTQGHKRKRSLQDSPVDLTLMQQARKCLVALQEELDGVVETTSEITAIMTQVDALQAILGTAKKPTDLMNVGIQRKFLQFDATQLHNLLTHKRAAPDEQIRQLCTRIARIYRHVSMRVRRHFSFSWRVATDAPLKYEPSVRMILDAILLAAAEICADGDAKLPVAILPEMRIASGDGILLKNPTTSFEMWFTGTVDYGVCTYENQDQRKDRVLNADVDDVRLLAKSQIFLVEGKHLQDKPLYDFMPEAISQGAGLCEVTETMAVRFCLTDGRKWIFSVFVKDGRGARVGYEGSVTTILEPRLDPEGRDSAWERSIHQIVELVYHWVRALLSASFVTYTDHHS